ncbi:MAG: TolC family protein [Planctomycetota bacterium]|jgi:outer membrane protein TolC
MSKRFFVEHWFVLFAGLSFLLFSGCDQYNGNEEFYEIQVPEDKLRQIVVLDLEQMEDEGEKVPDVNEAAAKELELTLEESRALALENNLSLKVQLVNPTIAAQRVSEEEAKFEAAFTSNVNYSKTDVPLSTELEGSQEDRSSVDMGIQVPLRTGGTVNFNLVDSRFKSDSAHVTLNPAYITNLSVSISQPLLRNAGNRVNTHSIRIAEYDRQTSEARTKLEVITVIAAADRAYWRLYAARQELAVRKQQYDLAQAQLEQAQRFVESGERAQVEVIRADAGVAERLEGIIISENGVRDRERELKQILNKPGLETQTPTVLIPATDVDPVHYDLSEEQMVAAAIENRMEMLELELALAKDISTIDFMRNQALPAVTLGYTYNINGLGATRGDAYDLLHEKRFEDHFIGLQVLVPLGNEAAKSRLLQSIYQRRQRLATRERRKTLIELEVLTAVDQLEANWQRILASRQSSILQGRVFKAEKRQFELGLRTSTDVLDAQTKFAEAQSSEIRALAEYQIAQIDLAFATGTLLGAAKVQWEPIVPETR